MSSLQEILDRAIVKYGPDRFIVKQLKNQIMAEKKEPIYSTNLQPWNHCKP